MIARGEAPGRAVFSDDRRYRYLLTRRIGPDWGRLGVVMLNPSTADERADDPTIRRCETRARTMGAGELAVVNLYAFRATRPDDLFRSDDPAGPANDGAIREALSRAAAILCAWGGDRRAEGRAREVAAVLRSLDVPLFHLGLCRNGAPRHPLYVSGTRQPERWAT
ncbi:MAG: DUF1643 domain-containing protein [Pseudomonadota bacterium]